MDSPSAWEQRFLDNKSLASSTDDEEGAEGDSDCEEEFVADFKNLFVESEKKNTEPKFTYEPVELGTKEKINDDGLCPWTTHCNCCRGCIFLTPQEAQGPEFGGSLQKQKQTAGVTVL